MILAARREDDGRQIAHEPLRVRAVARPRRAQRAVGALGECTLCPAGPRLPFERLLLVGMGLRERFDDSAFDRARKAGEICPVCQAEIRERPLFTGTYLGCLC